MSMWSRRTAHVFALLLGASGCRDKVVPQPEPTPSIAPTPIASVSASAASEARRAPWRTSPNQRFDELKKQCEENSLKACDDALTLSLETNQFPSTRPFTKANVESLPALAKKACDAGSKLGCAFLRRGEIEKLMQGSEPRIKLEGEICGAGGDPICLVYRNGGTIEPGYDTVNACERGIGTECLAIVTSIAYDSPWIKGDPAIYAQKACDIYIQTCHHAIQALLFRNHSERRSWKVVNRMFERIVTEQSKRCAEGHPTCGFAAHAMLELGRDIGEVRRYAEAGIEDGDQLAHWVLARLADEGIGQPADPAAATEHYKKCGMVEWGDEDVCFARLSALYEAGRGIQKDTKEAFRFALLGRNRGFATPAMLRYFRLIHEKTPPPSREEILKEARFDCEEKFDPRCPTLWKLIEEGKPIPEALP